jgi:hypothetical protein
MQPAVIEIYENPAFWAVLVSIISIFLSQVRPVKEWFKKAELDLEVYSKISITQKIGNPNLSLHLLLTNIGGRKIRVKALNVTLSKDGNEFISLPASSFLHNQSDQNPLLFTTFSLLPNQEWAHIVNFLNAFDRDDENVFHALEKNMLDNYREQTKELKENEKDKEKLKEKLALIEHPEDLTNQALAFFKSKFIWDSGEYFLKINVVTYDDEVSISKSYNFTIFESQTEQQKESTEQYKYGGDIWWDLKKLKHTNIPIREA